MLKREQERRKNRIVYYCAMRDGRIKIGSSIHPEIRIKGVWSEENQKRRNEGIMTSAIRPVIAATEPGGEEKELKRHKQFAKDRMMGEFFFASEELVKLIFYLRMKSSPESAR